MASTRFDFGGTWFVAWITALGLAAACSSVTVPGDDDASSGGRSSGGESGDGSGGSSERGGSGGSRAGSGSGSGPEAGGGGDDAGRGGASGGGAGGAGGEAGRGEEGGYGSLCWICPPGRPCRHPECGNGSTDIVCLDVCYQASPAGGISGPWYEEACDDGNLVADDGCSPECTVELLTCGNGVLDEDEDCDDGNTYNRRDGCTRTCELDNGWICDEPGMPCRRTVCGDGRREYEMCDDGNTEPGDGCNERCQTQTGWLCERPGEPCWEPFCGDTYVTRSAEVCDDGNALPNDGCSETCQLEDGWACDQGGLPARGGVPCRQVVCGDGQRDNPERCDDGNTEAGDGCSPTCTAERGWHCDGDRPCERQVCGDGITQFTESCDDGNTEAGDGCSADCDDWEDGFRCPSGGGPCLREECGNGVVQYITLSRSWEDCDDGNTEADDGCSDACGLEPGWVCPEPNEPCRRSTCGDGLLDERTEECDDGNLTGDDGCTRCSVDGRLCETSLRN